MKVLGYLFVMALFGGNNKPVFENVENNYKIEFQKVGQLAKDLFKNSNDTNGPIFTRDDLVRGNLVNKGTVAKYYSKTVRDYIIHHNVSAEEDGFVLTLHNFNNSAGDLEEDKDSKYIEKTPTVIFIPKEGVDVNDVENKELSSAISGYIDSVQNKIDSGEIGVPNDPLKKDKPGDLNKTNKPQFEYKLRKTPPELLEKQYANILKHINMKVNTNEFENITDSARKNNGPSQEIDKIKAHSDIIKPSKSTNTTFTVEPTTITSKFNNNVSVHKTNKTEENKKVPQKENYQTVKDNKPNENVSFDWTKWESYLKDNNSSRIVEKLGDNEEEANLQEHNLKNEPNDSHGHGGKTTLIGNVNDKMLDEKTNLSERNNKVPQEENSSNVKVVKPMAFDWTKWESYLKDNNSTRAEGGMGVNEENANSHEDDPKTETYDRQVKLKRTENTTKVLKTSNQIDNDSNNAVGHNGNHTLTAPHDIKEENNSNNENEFQRKWDLKEKTEPEENFSDSEEDCKPVLEIIDEDELERAEKEGYYIEFNRSELFEATNEEDW